MYGKTSRRTRTFVNTSPITQKKPSQIGNYFFVISFIHSRQYLLNVVNTINENSVVNAVLKIRQQREKAQIEESPILLTAEFVQLFKKFKSITTD